MKKRKAVYSRQKGPLKRAYTRIQRQKKVRKMRRVVRAKRNRGIQAMTPLRQPRQCIMKFKTHMCEVFRLYGEVGSSQAPHIGADHDETPAFPDSGIIVHQNSLYAPGGHESYLPIVGGFTDVSHQYGQYRVIGCKITFKVRRVGTFIPWSFTGVADVLADDKIVRSEAAMNPDAADPLLITCFDRSSWQDANSMIQHESVASTIMGQHPIKGWRDLQQFKHLRGIKYRELRPGVAARSTIVHKWNEKRFKRDGSPLHGSDMQKANTGNFYNEEGGWTQGGSSPPELDIVRFDIREFDEFKSTTKSKINNARFMVTVEVDYLALLTKPRYTYNYVESH